MGAGAMTATTDQRKWWQSEPLCNVDEFAENLFGRPSAQSDEDALGEVEHPCFGDVVIHGQWVYAPASFLHKRSFPTIVVEPQRSLQLRKAMNCRGSGWQATAVPVRRR
jgi:hypothetical protein